MTRYAALTSMLIAMTAGLMARDWPQIGGNPQHTNYTDDSPEPVEGNFWGSNKMTDWRGREYTSFFYPVAWVKTFWPEQMLHAQPVIAEGRLFIGTLQGNLYALDARTGDRLWCFSTDSSGTGMPILQSAAVDQGRVFFGCMDGKLYASIADTGALLWETDAGSPVSASPCAADGMVFIGGRCGEFLAVNAVDGSVKWRRQLSWLIDSTAAYHEGRVFVLTEDSKLHCLSAEDGETLWEYEPPCGGFFRGQYPVIHKGRVLFRPIPYIAGFNTTNEPLFQWNDFKTNKNNIQTLSEEIHEAMLPDGSRRLPDVVEKAQESLLEWYETNPWGQTYYVVDAKTGVQKAPVPHQHTLGALAAGVMPPAVCQDGTVMVNILWGGGNYARLDLDKNRLVDICVELLLRTARVCNGDEDHYVSIGGRRAFIKHFMTGGVNNECVWDYRERDAAFPYDWPQQLLHSSKADVWHEPDEANPFLKQVNFNEPGWWQTNTVSILPARWSPSQLSWRTYGGWSTGGGAMPIVGDMFYHQERSCVIAWRGK